MKIFCTILFALFPFLHDQRYTVSLHQAENQTIVVEENGNPFEITLFNLRICDDEGWQMLYELLDQAKTIEIEVDSSTKIAEPLPVYLFVDGELVQEKLIASLHAYTIIHNPEYRYEKRLLEIENAQSTMALPKEETTQSTGKRQGRMFFLFLFLSWIITIFLWYKESHHISIRKHFTKS